MSDERGKRRPGGAKKGSDGLEKRGPWGREIRSGGGWTRVLQGKARQDKARQVLFPSRGRTPAGPLPEGCHQEVDSSKKAKAAVELCALR